MVETLTIDGHMASRETIWRREYDGSVYIDYADGAPLVHFFAPLHDAEAVHNCGQDRYLARLTWRDPSDPSCPIRLSWRVFGPGKDYVMVSVYTPILEGQA